MNKIFFGIVKIMSFLAAFISFIMVIPYKGLMEIDFKLTEVLLSIFLIAVLIQMVLFAYGSNKSNYKMFQFMFIFIELALAFIAMVWFCKNQMFNAVMFFWLMPMFIRWYLPQIFKSIHSFKKRST